MSTFTDTDKIAVLKLLAKGKDFGFVRAANMHLSDEEVREIAQSGGYPDRDKMQWAIDTLQKHVDERSRELPAAQTPAPRADIDRTRPRVLEDQPRQKPAFDATADLLLKAAAHPRARVQSLGKKISDQLVQLRDAIASAEADEKAKRAARERREAEKRSRERAKQQMRDEVRRLEAELKAARAKLRGKAAPTTSANSAKSSARADRLREAFRAKADAQQAFLDRHGVTSRDVRDWAAVNSVQVAPTGLLPNAVLEAYDQAHEAKAS